MQGATYDLERVKRLRPLSSDFVGSRCPYWVIRIDWKQLRRTPCEFAEPPRPTHRPLLDCGASHSPCRHWVAALQANTHIRRTIDPGERLSGVQLALLLFQDLATTADKHPLVDFDEANERTQVTVVTVLSLASFRVEKCVVPKYRSRKHPSV